MYNITLICTKHKSSGNCNASNLYELIRAIKPQVIFEELSWANFHKSYGQGKLLTLETNAIKLYLLDNKVEHVPVDTFELPNFYDEMVDKMYDVISDNDEIIECGEWRKMLKNLISLQDWHGFEFLNSDANDEIVAKLDSLEQTILEIMNDEQLFEIRRMRKQTIERREEEMLKNIYSYSQEHLYNQALFFIGAGHRRSVIEKIKKAEKRELVKLNWKFV